ncbi:MAG: alanine--tRNA ligase-related protein [Candidatus Aminicenantes bacterium]|nr:alanine--tRNA ligase-related protein [Candidatus Aminicenantes bacterium]
MVEKTTKLFHEDAYKIEFEANVIEKTQKDQKFFLVLDQTCFYPESGGQPSDKGTLNGVRVNHVEEQEGKIVHVLEKDVSEKKVSGKIDWKKRFDFMQQHAGQHILSQSLFELFQAKTLSFHLGAWSSTIEIDLREISDKEIEMAEDRANAIVFQDRDIKSYIVSEMDIEKIPLRKPSQKKGLIRVIEVFDFDFSACGGTHPRKTGEIGLIKIIKWDRIRNNVRCEFVCGRRALLDYSLKNSIMRQMTARLTVCEKEIPAALEKLLAELKDQKKTNKKMWDKLIQYQAQKMIQSAEGNIIKEVFFEGTNDETKRLALNIINGGEFIVLFGLKLENRGHLILACSESLGVDMRDLIPIVSPLVEGRGGGSPSLVEIFAKNTENIETALDQAKNWGQTLKT